MKGMGERLNGLRWRLRAMRRLWSAGAEPDMTFLAPQPPEAGAVGEIDNPRVEMEIDEETLRIVGWVAFTDSPTARVEVWLDEEPLGRARIGLPRLDVGENTDLALATVSGFELDADLSEARRPSGAEVRVVATSVDDQTYAMDPVPISIVAAAATEGTEMPPPKPIQADGRGGGGGGDLRVLVATHQLNLGGAQLYLMDLLRGLQRRGGMKPTVISARDGELRDDLEAMGIPVHITSVSMQDDLNSHLGRIEELAAWARPHEFDLVFVNTATLLSLPGPEIAARLGIPAVWAIHESFEPAVLWANVDPEVRGRAEARLSEAAFAIFEAEATERIFEPLVGGRGRMLPYGLDHEPIDARRASFDPAAARREAGLPEDARVVVCIGTVEPRKAQIPLAQAFDQIADRHPDTQLAFVGGRDDDPYSEVLEECISSSRNSDQMRLIPITPDVEPWYGMADLLVCASDVESLPRTVLEAMAWETPVLATEVFGLPELITEGETGWLCEARDVPQLTAELDRALSAPAEQVARIGRAGRELVECRHDLDDYARQVGDLFEQAVRGRGPEPDVAAG
jgi:glycosyltransferase involved in cell wall biosynthesis